MSANLLRYSDSYLSIDLDAIAYNWRHIDGLSGPNVTTAAMVKADGYGLGANRVGLALAAAGCTRFFVATISEAIALRQMFDHTRYDESRIMVLHGVNRGEESDFHATRLIPVLNDLEQIARWKLFASKLGQPLSALLHFDTGMNRLGLDSLQTDWLIENPDSLDGLDVEYLMSHLISGEIADDPKNMVQLEKFRGICGCLGGIPASLANSAGVFLGPDYHFHMTRPGIALYGVHPSRCKDAQLKPTLSWNARIIQIRTASAGETVGYNGTCRLTRGSRIATLGVGYADGYRRQLGNLATVQIGKSFAPVIGRVSMDSITVDVTNLEPDDLCAETAALIHSQYSLYQMAVDADTIVYEILTRLGRRPARYYYGQ
ncbi:MAG: alanine racemase [Candidatus Puniceispirillum sp.]